MVKKFFVIADEVLAAKAKDGSVRVPKDISRIPANRTEFNAVAAEIAEAAASDDVKLVLLSHGSRGLVYFGGPLINPGVLLRDLTSRWSSVGAAGAASSSGSRRLILDLHGCQVGAHVKPTHGVLSKRGAAPSAGEYADIPDGVTVIVNSGKYSVGRDPMYHVALNSAHEEDELSLILKRIYSSAETTNFIFKRAGKPIVIFKQSAPRPKSPADLTDEKIADHLRKSVASFLKFYSENVEEIPAEKVRELSAAFEATLADPSVIKNYRNIAYLTEVMRGKSAYVSHYLATPELELDPRVGSRMTSPFDYAASPQIITSLVEAGAELITPTAASIFKAAIIRDDLKLIKAFLTRKPEMVNMSIDGERPWRIATGHPKVRELLLQNGVDLPAEVFVKSLKNACSKGDTEMAEVLAKEGKKRYSLDTVLPEENCTALFYVLRLMANQPTSHLFRRWESIAYELLESGTDPRIPAAEGKTALMMAAKAGSQLMMKRILIKFPDSYDAVDSAGRNVLDPEYTNDLMRGFLSGFTEYRASRASRPLSSDGASVSHGRSTSGGSAALGSPARLIPGGSPLPAFSPPRIVTTGAMVSDAARVAGFEPPVGVEVVTSTSAISSAAAPMIAPRAGKPTSPMGDSAVVHSPMAASSSVTSQQAAMAEAIGTNSAFTPTAARRQGVVVSSSNTPRIAVVDPDDVVFGDFVGASVAASHDATSAAAAASTPVAQAQVASAPAGEERRPDPAPRPTFGGLINLLRSCFGINNVDGPHR